MGLGKVSGCIINIIKFFHLKFLKNLQLNNINRILNI